MGVAFGVEIVLHITAQHAAVGDGAVGGIIDRSVDIIPLDLDIGAIEDIVLAVEIVVLMFVGMLPLHVFEEKQRGGVRGMTSEGVRTAAGRESRPLRIVGSRAVKDRIALAEQLIVRRGRVLVDELAMQRDIPDLRRLEVDIDIFVQFLGIERNGDLRRCTANPRMQRHVRRGDRQQLRFTLAVRRRHFVAEIARHLAVFRHVVLAPGQLNRPEPFLRTDALRVAQIARIGHGIDAVTPIGYAAFERRMPRPALRLAVGTLLIRQRQFLTGEIAASRPACRPPDTTRRTDRRSRRWRRP